MLPLDDLRWAELDDAYHTAARVPDLLRDLARNTAPAVGPEAEPWYSLWSALCHQDDVYTASYAAVPHLVDTALKAEWPVDFGFLLLPAAIEIARQNGNGPAIPAFLEEAYLSAIARLRLCVERFATEEADQHFVQVACVTLAVANGHYPMAEAIMNLDDFWIEKINGYDFE